MTQLTWSEAMRFGVEIMDEEHEAAVAEINALGELAGGDSARLRAALAAFAEHCRIHFGHEEALMEECDFPAHSVHAAEHQRVLAELGSVIERLDAGDRDFVADYVTRALPEWLLAHLRTMDMVTAGFIIHARERRADTF
jgi:hemerythrin